MKITLSPRAEKQLKKASKVDQIILAKKIRELKKSNPSQAKKLSGCRNIFRIRLADFRIVYKKTSQEIYIILISHRKDVYRVLKKLLS